mgnify:CR=1 FL=1
MELHCQMIENKVGVLNTTGRQAKKPYVSPKLTVFGRVRELTTSGSGNGNEQLRRNCEKKGSFCQ